MTVRKILYPFAVSGNRRAVPDVSSLSQMAYDVGITYDYERPIDVDSQAKNIDREGWNGLMYDITDNIRTQQHQTYPDWVAPTGGPGDTGYPMRAMVRYNGERYLSMVANNMDVPTNGNSWYKQLKTSDVTYRIPDVNMGKVTAAGDLNAAPYATLNGVWDFPTDASIAQMLNAPSGAKAGYLETRATSRFRVQVYFCRGPAMYVRGLNQSGVWTAWKYISSLDDSYSNIPVDAAGYNSNADWNTFVRQPGIMQVWGANFGAPNSPPIPNGASGTLEILFGNDRSGIITQICRASSGGVAVAYARVRNPAGAWSSWSNIEGSTKVNMTGDTMTGRLVMQGPPGQDFSTVVRMKNPDNPNVGQTQFLRGWINGGSGRQEINIINKANNASVSSFLDSGLWWTPARPTWAGFTPWDTGNFDPNSKLPILPGGSYGRIFNNNANKIGMYWNGGNGWLEMWANDQWIGNAWQDRQFNPNNLAPRFANCHRNSGRSEYGPVSNGIAYECNQPQVLTGVGSPGGGSTANNIHFSSRWARNA